MSFFNAFLYIPYNEDVPTGTMESIVESASSPSLKISSPGGVQAEDEVSMSPDKVMQTLDIQNQDSWDSVSAQPSCVICRMTFPSQSKLDRHIKYSSMHADAVKQLEGAKNEGKTDTHA